MTSPYNPRNRVKAIKLVKTLQERGMNMSVISKSIGHDIWFISGMMTKGTNVNDETLMRLRNLAGEQQECQQCSTIEGDILALLKPDGTLDSQKIMRKLLPKGYRVGTIQVTLRALKSAGTIESPCRGHYKLAAREIPEKTRAFNESRTDNHDIAKLRREIRALRKLTRKLVANQSKIIGKFNSPVE